MNSLLYHLCIPFLVCLLSFSADGSHAFMERSKIHLRHDVRFFKNAASNTRHKLIFGIKQNNLDKLTDILHDVSDPLSPNYGKHWTKEEIVKFTVNPEANAAVIKYLESNNINVVDQTLNGEYITAEADVSQWESMLNCKFHVYRLLTDEEGTTDPNSDDNSNHVIRTESYSVPQEISSHLFAVFNTVQFPHLISPNLQKRNLNEKKAPAEDEEETTANLRVQTNKDNSNNDNNYVEKFVDWNQPGLREGAVTPGFIAIYYDVPFHGVTDSSLVTQAVVQSLNNAYNATDLTAFQKAFSLDVHPIAKNIGGPVNPNTCHSTSSSSSFLTQGCTAANLDVQYMMGVAQGAPTTYVYTNNAGSKGDQLDWLNFVTSAANSSKPAQVYSISYATYEFSLSESTMKAFETEVIKLGVMGTTIVASAGDDGVIGQYARRNASMCGYFAQYPASCPYVLAVGGTNGPQFNEPEIACMSSPSDAAITTGGGFSNRYPAPKWQQSFISDYFKKVDGTLLQPFTNLDRRAMNGGSVQPSYYNRSGRGYPDISLVAHNYLVYVDGMQKGVDGTSAAAPVMGALITLTNYQRKLKGNSTMGWVNPFLYHHSASFIRDITFGMNNCTANYEVSKNKFAHTCCKQGFHATVGWDPVTGLGSLYYRSFLEAAGIDISNFPTQSPSKAPTVESSTKPPVKIRRKNGVIHTVGVIVGSLIGFLFIGGLGWLIVTRCCMRNGRNSAKVISIMPTGGKLELVG
jgi:tripeptidyl-peptidase-1